MHQGLSGGSEGLCKTLAFIVMKCSLGIFVPCPLCGGSVVPRQASAIMGICGEHEGVCPELLSGLWVLQEIQPQLL